MKNIILAFELLLLVAGATVANAGVVFDYHDISSNEEYSVEQRIVFSDAVVRSGHLNVNADTFDLYSLVPADTVGIEQWDIIWTDYREPWNGAVSYSFSFFFIPCADFYFNADDCLSIPGGRDALVLPPFRTINIDVTFSDQTIYGSIFLNTESAITLSMGGGPNWAVSISSDSPACFLECSGNFGPFARVSEASPIASILVGCLFIFSISPSGRRMTLTAKNVAHMWTEMRGWPAARCCSARE